jgi:eukaryotic-like serine/threonine-protein kinase
MTTSPADPATPGTAVPLGAPAGATERLSVALADRYRIERELGQGGMATVYLAHDLRHDRDVAIKVLHPELGATLGGDRFLTEIRTTARLQHPHILPLLDSGEASGLLFYVMPVVDGETLRARLERERQLPLDDAIRIATEAASALAYAHRHGVIHRDIKPENILLHDGRAVVADFGIALAVSAASGPRMTQTGLSLGTPQYMAPEQAMGERQIDGRADVYALGAVLYELLTGEPPFSGATVQAIVAKVLTERPASPTAVRDTIPRHVEATVLKALAKLPADRFATPAQFADALAHPEIMSATAGATPAPGAPMPYRAPTGIRKLLAASPLVWVALAATVSVAITGWMRRDSRTPLPALAVPLADVPGIDLRGTVAATQLTLSPDGSQLAFTGTDSIGESKLFVRSLVDPDAGVTVASTIGAGSPAFSPDGKTLAFWVSTSQAIQTYGLATRTLQTLGTALPVRGLTWIDNTTIVYVSDRRLWRRSVNGSAPELVVESPPGVDTYLAPFAVRSDVVLLQIAATGRPGELAALSLRDKRLVRLGIRGTRPQFVGSGVLTYLSGGSLWGVPFDPATLELGGQPTVISQVSASLGVTYAGARNGTIVIGRGSAGGNRELVLVNRSGVARPLIPERRGFRWPRFSPDGKRIVVGVTPSGSAGGFGDIWLTSAGGGLADDGTLTRLTADSTSTEPEWDPDGRHVIFVRREQGRPGHLARIAADGSVTATTVIARPNPMYESAITPDRRTIVWREDASRTTRDILMAPLDSPSVVRPIRNSAFDERGIALSPDGRWLAYTSNETGTNEVYICRLEPNGVRWKVSRRGGSEPRWARTGELFYRKADSIFVTPIATGSEPTIGPAALLFAGKEYIAAPFEALWDVSPNGQRFVMVREASGPGLKLVVLVNWMDGWRTSREAK